MMRSYAGRKEHATSSVKDKGLSLGALSTFAAILAPFLGYLLAYGWRSGEAQYYGIRSSLIVVSLEDGLHFAVPILFALLSFLLIVVIDTRGKGAVRSTRKAIAIVVLLALCLLASCGIMGWSSAIQNVVLFGIALVFTLGIMFIFIVKLFGFLFAYVSSSIAATFILGLTAWSVYADSPIASAVSLSLNAFALFLYLGVRGEFAANKKHNMKTNRHGMLACAAIGVVSISATYLFAVYGGYSAAEAEERTTLPSGEVVLVTYGGDRSVVGMVENKHVSEYRVVHLSDEGPWVVENVELEGYPLLPF